MKLRITSPAHYDSGPNLTPLVDVVLVVLIFVMLAGSFGGRTHFLKSTYAEVIGGRRTSDPFKLTLDLYVKNDAGGVRSGGGVFSGVGIQPTSDVSSLAQQLRDRFAQFSAAGSPMDVQVVIHPGNRVHYDRVMQAYEAALRAGFSKVAFASTQVAGSSM